MRGPDHQLDSQEDNRSFSPTAPYLTGWQDIRQQDGNVVKYEQLVMMVASWLLCLLAVASVAVLVVGRVAGQIRRAGLRTRRPPQGRPAASRAAFVTR